MVLSPSQNHSKSVVIGAIGRLLRLPTRECWTRTGPDWTRIGNEKENPIEGVCVHCVDRLYAASVKILDSEVRLGTAHLSADFRGDLQKPSCPGETAAAEDNIKECRR